jgi:hypothetical protein
MDAPDPVALCGIPNLLDGLGPIPGNVAGRDDEIALDGLEPFTGSTPSGAYMMLVDL